jgi:putative ABC transport system permease protein
VNGTSLQTIQLGLRSLLLQKMRTGLAALGIFIGTTTVIWLVAMGEGVSFQAREQIKNLGATNIIVRSVKPNKNSKKREGRPGDDRVTNYGLLRDDYRRILSNIPTVRRAVPMREVRFELHVKDRIADTKLVGCSADYLDLNQLAVARGRWFSSKDEGDNVIVLADGTARRLFPYENPVGKTVRLPTVSASDIYTVIGQTRPRDPSAAIGGSLEARDYNTDAYILMGTWRRRIGDFVMWRQPGGIQGEVVELSQITVSVDDINEVDETAAAITTLLEQFHGKKQDYAVVVPKELLRQAERTRAMFNVLLVVIAGISLLVGGIGIMNIMLATVTERTREIGIRRSLGATRRDIIHQFLGETLLLTSTGGLLGVLCGLMCGPIFRASRNVVTMISPDLLPPIVDTLEPRIAPWSVVLSLFISLGVGFVFGVYPARQAAYLDPIEALRHE